MFEISQPQLKHRNNLRQRQMVHIELEDEYRQRLYVI